MIFKGLTRNHINADELLSLSVDQLRDILGYWEKPIAGDCFFIKEQPGQAYFVESFEELDEDTWQITYCGGKTVSFEDCYPLFSASQMLQLLQLGQDFELRPVDERWILNLSGYRRKIYRSLKNQDLISFLWRVSKSVVETVGLE